MSPSATQKRATFRQLHESGCFVLPNPWDAGSAVALERLGFKALATTSAGMAWAMGRPDGAVSLDETLVHLTTLAHATRLPLNADFENGHAHAPAAVAANVALALDTGIAGLSVEDYGGAEQGLYDVNLAAERIAAAREAIDGRAPDVVLTARAEGLIRGQPDLDEVIRRLTAYAAAGADCLYAPGLSSADQVRAVVEAAAPKPVNVHSFTLPVAALAELGARRISLGGRLAAAAWGEFLRAARRIADDGVFDGLAQGASGRELNGLFAPRDDDA
jgi:2-methylisocitrate lyase-like PEP mutase family enzyme